MLFASRIASTGVRIFADATGLDKGPRLLGHGSRSLARVGCAQLSDTV
jgi:hypothetical protein